MQALHDHFGEDEEEEEEAEAEGGGRGEGGEDKQIWHSDF